MYARLSLTKLASLCGPQVSEAEVRTILQAVRSAQMQLVRSERPTGGWSLIPGVPTRCSDVDFGINESTLEVEVKILKSEKNACEAFLREIARLEEMCM